MLGEILKFEITKEGLVKLYDRFSFDELFRLLLINGFEREQALNFILCNCALSALVFQERIHNGYYQNIRVDEVISPDLLQLKGQCLIEVIQAEIEEVTEEDCFQYIYNLVINRTFDGYQTEIKTIYGKLQRDLGVKIEPAPDEWDRLYNVDFYIQVGSRYIGLQIKPITYEQTPEVYRWKEWLGKTHDEFEKDRGGKVFIVFSIKKEGKKVIYNPEVIDEIKKEIHRLGNR